MGKHKFEVKKDGRTYAAFDDRKMMYPDEIIKTMKQNGYKIYEDGRIWKEKRKGD